MLHSDLVSLDHLSRSAVVYIRQSTPHQVISNQESRRLQYALKQRALDLGWLKEEDTMAKYISLVKYTAKGIENIKESPGRLDAFKQLCESMGAKVEGFYLTMGRYDLVVIVDAPDHETISKIILATSSKGAISTETLPALAEEEYRKVISEMP